MAARKATRPAADLANEPCANVHAGRPNSREANSSPNETCHSLHFAGARKPLVEIVPDAEWPRMYRIAWPDGLISPMANLTRCMDAARVWAERKMLTDLRKKRGVGALKSLDNFSWLSRHVAGNRPKEDRASESPFAQSVEQKSSRPRFMRKRAHAES
jgi:hypothetical protein